MGSRRWSLPSVRLATCVSTVRSTGPARAGFDTAAYENGGGAAMTIMDEAWFWPAVAAVAAGVFFLTKKKGAKYLDQKGPEASKLYKER